MENKSAPEPEKKKELKVYSFTRNIPLNEKDAETPGKDDPKINGCTLNLSLKLYDKEISLTAQRERSNPKLPNILYEKYISLETLQSLNKFFSLLDTEKIFVIIKNALEQKLDHITIEEDKIKIKIIINFMEVMTEEILLELEQIKLSNEEETTIIKESIKFLTEERDNLKNEITALNNTVEELKKTSSQKNDEMEKKLEENKNQFEKKLEEKEKESLEKEKAFQKRLEENKNDFEKKLEENKNDFEKKMEENKNDFEKKMEENKNVFEKKMEEYQNMFAKLQKEMSEVKEIEKYVKEKIIIEEKKEEEIKSHSLERKKTINSNQFIMYISMILLEDKIKFKIKEIQDNLKNNPTLYETGFEMNYFGKLSDYYKNQGGIQAIFEFLILRFNDNEDIIIKEKNKIIIKVKYTFGSKEDEISFEINKKEIALKKILNNIDESLKYINKDLIDSNEKINREIFETKEQINKGLTNSNDKINKINREIIETKEQYKKNLLEKVYPIGSYYWSEKKISPESLFGGKWRKIEGIFLFASDSNHYVGQTGGEERHRLTVDEMPCHSHGYSKFFFEGYMSSDMSGCNCQYYPRDSNHNFLRSTTTDSCGGSLSHNNMPPFLTANCWKRTG